MQRALRTLATFLVITSAATVAAVPARAEEAFTTATLGWAAFNVQITRDDGNVTMQADVSFLESPEAQITEWVTGGDTNLAAGAYFTTDTAIHVSGTATTHASMTLANGPRGGMVGASVWTRLFLPTGNYVLVVAAATPRGPGQGDVTIGGSGVNVLGSTTGAGARFLTEEHGLSPKLDSYARTSAPSTRGEALAATTLTFEHVAFADFTAWSTVGLSAMRITYPDGSSNPSVACCNRVVHGPPGLYRFAVDAFAGSSLGANAGVTLLAADVTPP